MGDGSTLKGVGSGRATRRRNRAKAAPIPSDVSKLGNPTRVTSRSTRYENVTALDMPAVQRVQPKVAETSRKAVHLGIDGMLLLIICTLLIFGLLMVHSASWEYSLVGSNSPTRIFQRQLQWLAVGGIIAVMLAWVDYRRWQKYALWAMGGTILLLLSVLLVGEKRLGAVRSLFSGSGQPSELAKLMVVIYLSVWLYSKRDRLGEIGFGLLPMSAILGIVGGLIFLQPDFSAVATIVFLGGILFFLAGGDIRQIGLLVLGTIFIGALVVTLTPTGRERVLSYLGGLRDLTLASDHVRRSIEAFVRGGWFGVGIGKSVTKLTTLPVPHTDSIFAVVGEETGVLGSSFLVLMYGLMLWRGMLIARSAPDGLGRLLAAGLTVWLAMEAFINMAVMVGLLPFAGNALPFISAGGSNLIVSLAAVGILLNISRVSEKRREIEEKFFSAVVDLRRRYWRRSIPSTRRIASSDAKK